MTLDNYRDNLNGVQNRIKHRIRWYGEVIKVEEPILEYKIKQGELGYKESYPLLGFVFDEAFRFEDYLSEMVAALEKGFECAFSDTDLEQIEKFISYKGMRLYRLKAGILNSIISAMLQSIDRPD